MAGGKRKQNLIQPPPLCDCVHALWLNDLLLTNTFTPAQIRAIITRLEEMTRR